MNHTWALLCITARCDACGPPNQQSGARRGRVDAPRQLGSVRPAARAAQALGMLLRGRGIAGPLRPAALRKFRGGPLEAVIVQV